MAYLWTNDHISLNPSGQEQTYKSLAEALDDIKNREATLVIAESLEVGSGSVLIVPPTLTLHFGRGGQLVFDDKPAAEPQTLWILGSLEAGPYQIFVGPGIIKGYAAEGVGSPVGRTVAPVRPEWFASRDELLEDASQAIQKAIDLQAGPVELGATVYPVGQTIRLWGHGMSLRGQGSKLTTLKSVPTGSSSPSPIIQWGDSEGRTDTWGCRHMVLKDL